MQSAGRLKSMCHQVETCKTATKELLAMEAAIRASAGALRDVARNYEAPNDSNTEFKALLEEAEAAARVQCASFVPLPINMLSSLLSLCPPAVSLAGPQHQDPCCAHCRMNDRP